MPPQFFPLFPPFLLTINPDRYPKNTKPISFSSFPNPKSKTLTLAISNPKIAPQVVWIWDRIVAPRSGNGRAGSNGGRWRWAGGGGRCSFRHCGAGEGGCRVVSEWKVFGVR